MCSQGLYFLGHKYHCFKNIAQSAVEVKVTLKVTRIYRFADLAHALSMI